jgi:hypothetical protein
MRFRLAGVLFAALLGVVAALQAVGPGALASPWEGNSRSGSIDLGPALAFQKFPLYYAGDTYDGEPLTDVVRSKRAGNAIWFFIYGDCEPVDEESFCFPPLQVVNKTICDQFPARFFVIPKTFPFRGARAARPPTADTFDVYTGGTSVTFVTDDGRHQGRAARAIRGVGAPEAAGRLPAPPRGSLKGKMRCQRRWDHQVDGPHGSPAAVSLAQRDQYARRFAAR